MRKTTSWLIPLFIVLGCGLLVSAACARQSNIASPAPTEALSDPPTEVQIASPAPTETEPMSVPQPTEEPGPKSTSEETESDPDSPNQANLQEVAAGCLDCHTDQEMLIHTASPVEEIESENEGEG